MMTINQTDVVFFNKQPRHNFYSTQIWQTTHSCLFLRIAFGRLSFACSTFENWRSAPLCDIWSFIPFFALCILTSRNSWQKKASEGRRKMSVGGSEGSLPGKEGDDYTTYVVRANLYTMYYTLYNLHVTANLHSIFYNLYNLRAKLPKSHWNVHLPDNHSIGASTPFYEWHLGRSKVDLSRISSLTKCWRALH